MKQTIILSSAAAAVIAAAIFLFRKCRKKHSPIMTFRDLYEDNAVESGIIQNEYEQLIKPCSISKSANCELNGSATAGIAETIVTTSNGKYPILGDSGRGGKIINGKLIEY